MALTKSVNVCVFLVIPVICFVEGLSSQSRSGTVKTIYTEHGDIFDCVDIYKQPSLDHPFLKNETFKIAELLERFQKESIDSTLFENETDDCPHGTVPIIRFNQPSDNELLMMRNLKRRHQRNSNNTISTHDTSSSTKHEYVTVRVPPTYYFGAKALLNNWKPFVANANEFSLAQIWVYAGERGDPDFSAVEAGWIVEPSRYHDDRPRLFTHWTADDYESTGCTNLECKGFTLIGRKPSIVPGTPMTTWSTYNSKQYGVQIAIVKDQDGDWVLYVDNNAVGYWPGKLFKKLAEYSTGVDFGGEIINKGIGGHHTETQMGSGHPASEGPNKAAYIGGIKVMRMPHGYWEDPPVLAASVTRPGCYSVDRRYPFGGVGFFYGGRGYSSSCH